MASKAASFGEQLVVPSAQKANLGMEFESSPASPTDDYWVQIIVSMIDGAAQYTLKQGSTTLQNYYGQSNPPDSSTTIEYNGDTYTFWDPVTNGLVNHPSPFGTGYNAYKVNYSAGDILEFKEDGILKPSSTYFDDNYNSKTTLPSGISYVKSVNSLAGHVTIPSPPFDAQDFKSSSGSTTLNATLIHIDSPFWNRTKSTQSSNIYIQVYGSMDITGGSFADVLSLNIFDKWDYSTGSSAGSSGSAAVGEVANPTEFLFSSVMKNGVEYGKTISFFKEYSLTGLPYNTSITNAGFRISLVPYQNLSSLSNITTTYRMTTVFIEK